MVRLNAPMTDIVSPAESENQTCIDAGGHKLFLHSGYENGILFYGWDAATDWQFAGTIAAAFFMAFLFEFVRCSRNRYLIKRISFGQKRQWTFHVFTSALYGIQAVVGIAVILLIGTFHLWICLSVAAGLALGCLCFSVTSVSFTFNISQEHCV